MREIHVEPLGPANDTPTEVTQELVALWFVEDADALDPLHQMFFDGLLDKQPPNDPVLLSIWQSGAFAAELQSEITR
jgi:hypothetical protein